MNYKNAGVDIKKADHFISSIKSMVESTFNSNVMGSIGGFSGLYKISDDRYLAASTDGVGTKLLLSKELDIYDTIGIDLVAMNVNDLVCCGAKPLFFLDYIASGSIEISRHKKIIEGIVHGCKISEVALLGGETAEMPDLYSNNDFDLAGFCVGEVYKENLIDGKAISPNQLIISLASSGLHSNGFSLVRKLIQKNEIDLLKIALTPTRIYVSSILKLLKNFPKSVFGIANITGGGINNISRLNQSVDYCITSIPKLNPFFQEIKKRAKLTKEELYETFNMGIGMVLIIDSNKVESLCSFLESLGETVQIIGKTKIGSGKISL